MANFILLFCLMGITVLLSRLKKMLRTKILIFVRVSSKNCEPAETEDKHFHTCDT